MRSVPMKSKKYPNLSRKMESIESNSGKDKLFKTIVPAIIIILGLLVFSVTNTAHSQNVNSYIPERAFEHRDELYDSIIRNVPELPDYNYVGALIEHESCISLKHSRCWSATSELKNSREHSIGFFQIARAFNPNGSTRMDTLTGMKNKYKTRLHEASWDNLKDRPDLQMDVGTLLIAENYRRYPMAANDLERMAFQDAAYNGGPGWVQKERTACSLVKGCDDTKWFDNTEKHCMRSKKPIPAYGGNSICDISRRHPIDTLKVRLPKYQNQYFNEEYINSRKPKETTVKKPTESKTSSNADKWLNNW